jgi:hypothetical protein
MSNDECQMTIEFSLTNDEGLARGVYAASRCMEKCALKRVKARAPRRGAHLSFGLRHSLVIGYWSLVIFQTGIRP